MLWALDHISLSEALSTMLKCIHVVDSVATVHDVHTYTVAFSPSVLIKCGVRSFHQSLTRTPHESHKKTIHGMRHIVIIFHGGDWWCCEAQSLGDRCSDSFRVVVNRWPRELSCGVVFSGGPWLLDFRCLSNLGAVKGRRSSCLESHAKC